MNESEVREWINTNYGLRPELVDCILAQDDWQFLDAQTEHYAGQAWDPGPESYKQAREFALSALVECHDGPHINGCPQGRPHL